MPNCIMEMLVGFIIMPILPVALDDYKRDNLRIPGHNTPGSRRA